ncbi:MAG TPA: thiamine pyrophosphate-dependent enzyme [Rhabdochlamydiaceae bacterium]|nr:thiamine pyrophosphate-dependent enzyme [Rhabdochlamydiaceae bacterium]
MHTTIQTSHLNDTRLSCLKALEKIYLTRFMDDKMSKLVRQNKGGTFHLSPAGHEMIGVLSALALTPEKDWGLPYYRDRAFAIGLGCDLTELLAAFLARELPHHSGGRMMPDHFSHKKLRIPCQSSCVGSQFLQAVGVAKGVQLAGRDEVVYVSAGEGATSQGDFHEAINFACLHRLSVIFVIQDNGYAISVPVSEQTAGGTIVKMAQGYAGLSVFDVDGCDYEETSRALKMAVEKGRAKEGPSLIVAKVPRMGAHSNSDDPKKYKDDAMMAAEKERDPIPRFESWLQDMGLISENEIEEMRRAAFAKIEEATEAAEKFPAPDPKSCTKNVFKEVPSIACEKKEVMDTSNSIVMVDAFNHALDEEMERDAGVVVFGQDVARGKGGVFGISRNLTAKYGQERCFNTPLAESSIIGIALGMSLVDSFKPVAEIQFADYLWTGINQLFNELSSFHYRSNGEWNCPVVVRMPYGGYIQGGPYHSQSIEAFLSHCPGLKVVIPSNSSDAKRLLKAAIRDPNPVIILEHKALYRQRVFCARKETDKDELLPLGKANIVREGEEISVIAWGKMVCTAMEVAEKLEKEGISIEILDLRTLVPLDAEAISETVRKTGKVLIVHEAAGYCGFGAEVAARIVENDFEYLDAPVMRVTGKNCPVPYAKELEDAVLPQAEDLESALRKLASF